MFTGSREKRPNTVQALTQAVTEFAKAITTPKGTAVDPSVSNIATPGISPSKIANLRSNYLQQMRDLHSLFESGALTQEEFYEQKQPILTQLKTLMP